jgi:DNA-binding NarL/FixJ family response regulator
VENPDTKKIKVGIAAREFFYRLGVKTIISVIGVEPELFETNSYESTRQCLKSNPDLNYLLINDEVLPVPKDRHLKEIIKLCPLGKLMLIGEDKMDDCPCSNYISNIENQKVIVERFQEFFFEPEKNSKSRERLQLSDREIEVLKAVALGYSNKEIAEKLFISTNTVISHRKNLTEKLGIRTIAGLTVYAVLNNIIDPEDVKG